MRRRLRLERRLAAPRADVFDVLADHARYDRFDGIRRADLATPGTPAPNGLGAVRHIHLGPLRFEEEITAYEPGERLDYLIRRVRGLPFRHAGGSIRLTDDGTGTLAEWTTEFEIPIPVLGRAADKVFLAKLEDGFGKVLERSGEIAAAR